MQNILWKLLEIKITLFGTVGAVRFLHKKTRKNKSKKSFPLKNGADRFLHRPLQLCLTQSDVARVPHVFINKRFCILRFVNIRLFILACFSEAQCRVKETCFCVARVALLQPLSRPDAPDIPSISLSRADIAIVVKTRTNCNFLELKLIISDGA